MRYEIWMGEHYSHFERGLLHQDDGRTIPLKEWIHISTYGPDTILITDQEHYFLDDFPVCWFILKNGLEFYEWSEEITSITFHNETGRDMEIDGFPVLKNGETREFLRSASF